MPRAVGPSLEIAASSQILRELERDLQRAGGKVRKGAMRALNKSLRSGKSAASREIREEINLKKKVVDERINTRVISQRAIVGKVSVRDRRIELAEFMTRAQIAAAWRRQRARRGKGVSVKTYKKKGRQLYPGTFVQIGRQSRKWHVLRRRGRERYPVYIAYGPNMISEFEKTLGRFAARANEVLDRNLRHELNFALGKL